MKTRFNSLLLLPLFIAGLGIMLANSATAATHSVIKNFGGNDGTFPQANLTLSGNTLYGTTTSGGSLGYGTVFKVNTDGSGYTVLQNFSGGIDGGAPSAGVVVSGTTLYGTTSQGGSGYGTVFKLEMGFFAMLTTLHSFTGSGAGATPLGGLVLSGNTLYGTTEGGSLTDFGTVFKIDTDGSNFDVLYNFTGGADGRYPYTGLTLSGTMLYGTTLGAFGVDNGTVFAYDTTAPIGLGHTVLYSFLGGTDGQHPLAGLTLSGSGSTLYGTTSAGGSSSQGTVFKIDTDGNNYAVLYNFAGGTDGASPWADLTRSGNTLYGTTQQGGSSGQGTVFTINTTGSGYAVLHNFTGGSGGFLPRAGLTFSANTLYGTTFYGGGLSSSGTLFKLDLCDIISFVVAAKNQVVPTSPVGAKYSMFGVPARINNGNVAFVATLMNGLGGVIAANNAAIYAGAPGAEALVVRKDSFAPDASGTPTTAKFGNFSDPAYNNAGKIAFRGTLKLITPVTTADNCGLWSNSGGTMHLVARKGDVAPGTGGATFNSFTSFALPDTRDVVFLAALTTGTGSPAVTTANNTGIWVYNCSAALTKVIQKGDSITVNGSPKTLKTIAFLPSVGFSPGQSRNVNNAGGKLVYEATFTDTTTAIVGANY